MFTFSELFNKLFSAKGEELPFQIITHAPINTKSFKKKPKRAVSDRTCQNLDSLGSKHLDHHYTSMSLN
jgi:hypothetical protein